MKKVLFLTILATTAIMAPLACPQGQVKIDGACTQVVYNQGCVQYVGANECILCEYGYVLSNKKCEYADKPVTECCVLKDAQGACIQCAPGLYLDGSACSKVERPGCLEGNGLLCANCAAQFTNIKGRCFRKIPSCQIYSDNGICQRCELGYELLQGHCSIFNSVSKTPNCQQYNEYGCVVCDDEFFLTKDRICKPFQLGCLKYFRETCQVCSSEYKLINGRCTMEGCTSYSSQGCEKCAQPYLLIQGSCIIDNCLQSAEGRCQICKRDFRLKNGVCVKSQPDSCQGCAAGYFIGENGKCIKTVLGCLTYKDGRCTSCQNIFVWQNGNCLIPGCDKFTIDGCLSCFKSFELFERRCIIRNCQEYSYETRSCRQCSVGYHVENGICIKNNPLCLTYIVRDSSELCSKCREDYILTEFYTCEKAVPGCVYQNGKCISCASPFKRGPNNSCVIDGCETYAVDGCARCYLPYVEKMGACAIPNCDEVVQRKCVRCAPGHYLTLNGGCKISDPKCVSYLNEKCQACVIGYIFSNQGNCVREIGFCKTYDYDRCLECVAGYQLNNGNCYIADKRCQKYDSKLQGCIKCVKGFHSEEGTCKIDHPWCAVYQAEGYTQACIQCAEGHVFDTAGKICLKQTPGCIYTKGVCTSCRNPFVFNGVTCVIYGCNKYTEAGCFECEYPSLLDGDRCIIPFCSTYDSASVKCETCQAGYQLIQGKCYREDPKCVEYTKTGTCVKCVNQYILFEGVCVREDQYCLKYSKLGGCNECVDKYYLSPDSTCLPKEPGCVYQKGKCVYCNFPFRFHEGAQKCRIEGCLEAAAGGCLKCAEPFTLTKQNVCEIDNCLSVSENRCLRCTVGYHLKQGRICVKNDPSCLSYNEDGDCQRCDKGWMLMSSGECEIEEDNCVDRSKNGKCVACKAEYFLNRYYQCQVRDKNCEEYNNGDCVSCLKNFFLWQYICFPYSKGCVSYSGKQCIRCRKEFMLTNGECFTLKKIGLKTEGDDEQYDFEINPIDITKSKYDIKNLSPVSKLGKVFYSSFFSIEYTDYRIDSPDDAIYSKGWKAENARDGEYIGFTISDIEPVTFYALQLEGFEGNYIKEFYIEYSVDDNINFIRIEKPFTTNGTGLNTIYFTAVYARSIRIIIKSYFGWPATKIEFFYYDKIRFRKISNLKSLKYLNETIQAIFVNRVDNQMYINSRNFFNPAKSCQNSDVCFVGIELCQPRTIKSARISVTGGTVKKVYLTYSTDGRVFNCYEKCRQIVLNESLDVNEILLNGLFAKNVRITPQEWTGTPNMVATYNYQ